MHDKRFPASQAERLDNPERLVWLPPAEVIGALAVRVGDNIADVGAGTGYFSLPLSSTVGAQGKIYAVDAQAEMLAWIERKLKKANLSNIELIHAEAGQTGLPASSCDLFFLANLWHEIDDRVAVLLEAQRVLKRNGRIAILDWRPDVEPIHGPPLEHRIALSDALRETGLSGFEKLGSAEVGRYSWLVQGEKVQ
jgi:ubiquinone/menaquinone biosynthesis C-methylase UbiE